MSVKVQIVFHSLWGHVWKMAEAVAEGVREVSGAEALVLQAPEILPNEVLEKMQASGAKKAFAHVPMADPNRLAEADAIILGSGTRYGNVTASMQAFLDGTGGLWFSRALVGKIGSAFTSTATQHGGQEATILHMHTFFLHQGMLVAGIPYSCPQISEMKEITGGGPYGASTLASQDGRQPSANELEICRFQGKHVAELAARMKK